MTRWDHLSDESMREWIRDLKATAAVVRQQAEALERRADGLLAELLARPTETHDSEGTR